MVGNAATSIRRGPRLSSPESALEPLACVACRARKLKCDRTKPACGRCLRASDGPSCSYPESRRKPTFKRRNVKDLEVRLAQVEGLLKDGSGSDRKRSASDYALSAEALATHNLASDRDGSGLFSIITAPSESSSSSTSYDDDEEEDYPADLVDLGMTESAPPDDVIEALHTAYFANQHMFIPIVHRARYLKAYHGGPHMRPTMGLQYAIWAMAAQVHPMYTSFHDAFYRRARQYLESDEMKGHGEHFITIGHAQAWAMVAAYEARRLLFTRAAMSCSRCVRLVGMMGLSRLDDDQEGDRISATIFPPSDWTELEERRRVYWGAFCVDSHASISTGWPAVVNAAEATTHLPSSEEAFNNGVEENSCSLENVFSGSPYSTFSSAIIVCHLFNSILSHVQLKPGDRSEDYDNGHFWRRHRSLDTKLTSAFVFLPDRYRLPANFDNPVAVHTNLNLHAATICLHNAALERAETHAMPEAVLKQMVDRLLVAAHEVINIMHKTSHRAGSYRSPLAALSLYCATSVFIYQAIRDEKDRTRDAETAKATAQNIEFIMKCMDNGRTNNVTRLLLHQAILDVDRNGLAPSKHFSWFKKYSHRAVDTGHFVPVLARSSVSRHSWQQPPMAGRMPIISSHNNAVMKNQRGGLPGMTNGLAGGLPSEIGKCKDKQPKTTTCKRRRVQSQEKEGSSDTLSQSSSVDDDADPLDKTPFPRYGGAFVTMNDRTAGQTALAGGDLGPQEAMPNMPTMPPVLSMPPSRASVPSIFAHIQILDPWTGPSSSAGSTDFGIGTVEFPEIPNITEAPTACLDTAIQAVQAQADLELPIDPALLYPGLEGDGSGTELGNFADPDAWTSFLAAGDYDISGWTAGHNGQG